MGCWRYADLLSGVGVCGGHVPSLALADCPWDAREWSESENYKAQGKSVGVPNLCNAINVDW
jgi:hypothetical protein